MEIAELIKNTSEFSVWEENNANNNTVYQFDNFHFHPMYEIILVLDGKIVVNIENREYIAQANSLIIIESNERHQIHIQEYPYKRIGLQIETRLLQKMLDFPQVINSTFPAEISK